MNVRKILVNALVDLEKSEGFSNLLLDSILKKEVLNEQDKAFASRLFYGVIERKITIDFYISKLTQKPIKKLSPIVLNSLRIAIYQLEYMDKIPGNAAVNESVAIVKNSKEKYAAGLTNAVLRNFIRNKPQLPNDNSLYSLSVRYSCPVWFIEELISYIGKENAIGFLENSLNPAPLFLKANRIATTKDKLLEALEGQNILTCDHKNNCIEISGSGALEKLKEFKDGLFHIQDRSSQLCVAALDPKPNDRVLDICSAPGGKSCTVAELMNNSGEVISCDLYEHRVKLIKSNADRLGLNIVKPMINDALIYNDKLGKFNKILCDVPCSGFGVIRRKPEIKYKPKTDLTNLPELQYNILEIASKYLEEGGSLIYSTCTLRYEENEAVVIRFLEEHPEFTVCEFYPEFFGGVGHILTPNNCGGDGFFFAVLKRK